MNYGKLRLLLKILRPKQWIKNLLILAAPIAGNALSANFERLLIAVLGFILASAFGYLINDWLDRERDRLHPRKRNRPFASGELQIGSLIILSLTTLLCLSSICLILGKNFGIVVLIYLVITISYSIKIKQIPILEFFWLASGFLIRAIAGSVIIEENPTGWFIIVIYFGSIFLTLCKRRSEKESVSLTNSREVLSQYAVNFLEITSAVFAGVTLITYSLWVIQEHNNSYFAYLSIATFSCALISYLLMSLKGKTESPENDLFSNKLVFSMGTITIGLLLAVFYR